MLNSAGIRGQEIPPSAAIARQMRLLIEAGALKPGAAVHSIREMARELGTAKNTVVTAYRQLEEDGYLTKHWSGRFVVAEADALQQARFNRARFQIAQLCMRLQSEGYSKEEILAALYAQARTEDTAS